MQINLNVHNDKYIYLDWQVIKYMKEPRLDKGDIDNRLKDAVYRLKKKYKFPYSMAHIKDRANNYASVYYDKVKEDFAFAETINDNFCLGLNNNALVIVKKSMIKCFDEYIQSGAKKEYPIKEEYLTHPFRVDLNKIDVLHPMYDFLKAHNGEYSVGNMKIFLKEMYESIFRDSIKYKQFRAYVTKMDLSKDLQQVYSLSEQINLDRLLYYMFPFLDSFQNDSATLMKKWPQIAERWFSLNNTYLSQGFLLTQGYTLLDIHPLFNEKLKKDKNTLDNIIRDGSHCFYASNAQYFISEDANTRKKTEFLYGAYGIKTKVLSESEFLNCFDF